MAEAVGYDPTEPCLKVLLFSRQVQLFHFCHASKFKWLVRQDLNL
ncbi:MAG: hypothetical protein PHF67_05225 [Candidatus Nanoarchaeia archaeon]|nr:hypothetical protein [Candidatus Nanoarchaeia archaeon]